MTSICTLAAALGLSLASATGGVAAQTETNGAAAVGDDRAAVFRFDPFQNKLFAVPPSEIKAGNVYNRFSPRLGRRVWSLATGDGAFVYAMGEGSTQPARQFDLRATPEQRTRYLADKAPALAQMLSEQGGSVHFRLNARGQWKLVDALIITKVFDLATGQRWEWHGDRRVAVLHTYGDRWQIVDGAYQPVETMVTFACASP